MAKPSMDLSTFVDKRLEGQDGGVVREGVRDGRAARWAWMGLQDGRSMTAPGGRDVVYRQQVPPS